MTKAEFIERYGAEKYEERKNRTAEALRKKYKEDPDFRQRQINGATARCMTRYNSDAEFRTEKKKQNLENCKERYKTDFEYRLRNTALKYVREGELELIENYEQAKAENFNQWVVHHRLEISINNEVVHSQESLKRLNMFFNRPYYELIFMKLDDHARMHRLAEKQN